MNFIVATVEIASHNETPVFDYGLEYAEAAAIIPNSPQASTVLLRLLCYNGAGPKKDLFKSTKPGSRVLVTGSLCFDSDPSKPMDLIITTIEPSIPSNMYCNQVVLGNAFFGSSEIKPRRNGQVAVKIGTTMDDSDTASWLFLETAESKKPKLEKRIRKGRPICVQGYFREYRKEDSDSPYRAIVASDFTTRKERDRQQQQDPSSASTAAGYTETDPLPTGDF